MALTDKLTAIANAIRGKTGKTEPLTLDAMPGEIEGISTGGVSEQEIITELVARTFPRGDIVLSSGNFTYGVFKGTPITSFTATHGCYANGNEFNGCKQLIYVEAPLITKIGASCFSGCSALKRVYAPKGYCEMSVFNSCIALEFVELCLLGNGTKIFSGCTSLSTVVLRDTRVSQMNNVNVFENTPFASGGTGGTVYVPAALISDYQQATNWATLYAAGTCNFVAIEGSEYE